RELGAVGVTVQIGGPVIRPRKLAKLALLVELADASLQGAVLARRKRLAKLDHPTPLAFRLEVRRRAGIAPMVARARRRFLPGQTAPDPGEQVRALGNRQDIARANHARDDQQVVHWRSEERRVGNASR